MVTLVLAVVPFVQSPVQPVNVAPAGPPSLSDTVAPSVNVYVQVFVAVLPAVAMVAVHAAPPCPGGEKPLLAGETW